MYYWNVDLLYIFFALNLFLFVNCFIFLFDFQNVQMKWLRCRFRYHHFLTLILVGERYCFSFCFCEYILKLECILTLLIFGNFGYCKSAIFFFSRKFNIKMVKIFLFFLFISAQINRYCLVDKQELFVENSKSTNAKQHKNKKKTILVTLFTFLWIADARSLNQ